jgi:hypothetical protein
VSFGLVFDWNRYSYFEYPVLYYLLIPYVLLRDGYCCQVCGKFGYWKISEGSGWFYSDGWLFVGIVRVGSVGLFVHHLDGDKRNSDLDNLVTVCGRCHSWVGVGVYGRSECYVFGCGFRQFWRLVERRAPTEHRRDSPVLTELVSEIAT